MPDEWKNKLYFGDNLDILREHVPDGIVDLVYLDPPFNSKANYNILFSEAGGKKSAAQITAFGDTWHWGEESEHSYHETVTTGPKKLADLLQAFRSFLGQNDMMAYLTMMAPRLVELHRVLKPTGSIYLHCDPTASHYIKLLMDSIFGPKNFRNEIVWAYRGGGTSPKDFGNRHDIIFRFSKSNDYFFYPDKIRIPYQAEGIKRTDDAMWGKHSGTNKVYKPHPLGKVPEDWWPINVLNANDPERLGYPTQKPEVLLERVVLASSDESGLVLDPFAGCGTAVAVAERFHRRWIGIDITYLAVNLMKRRLQDAFGAELSPYEVIGDPTDLANARALSEESRYQFEWWALDQVDARPAQDKKKGADMGIDGYIYFFDDESGNAKKIVVQVKSGNVNASHIRDLKGVIEREKAAIGVYLTLEEPTRPMLQEAIGAGYYVPTIYQNQQYPRVQILTIKQLLEGKRVEYPRVAPGATFKKATRQQKGDKPEQGRLL